VSGIAVVVGVRVYAGNAVVAAFAAFVLAASVEGILDTVEV
jgi:hypothetical protein